MRQIVILLVCLACLGCGRTPQEEYETALHVFVMERQRLDRMDEDVKQYPGEKTFLDRWLDQSARLKRAGKMLDEAEANLPDE